MSTSVSWQDGWLYYRQVCLLSGLMAFKDSLVRDHDFVRVLLLRYDLISIEEEWLDKEVLGEDVVNAVMGMAMVNIAEDHHIFFRVDEGFQSGSIIDLWEDDAYFAWVTGVEKAAFNRIVMRFEGFGVKRILFWLGER